MKENNVSKSEVVDTAIVVSIVVSIVVYLMMAFLAKTYLEYKVKEIFKANGIELTGEPIAKPELVETVEESPVGEDVDHVGFGIYGEEYQ